MNLLSGYRWNIKIPWSSSTSNIRRSEKTEANKIEGLSHLLSTISFSSIFVRTVTGRGIFMYSCSSLLISFEINFKENWFQKKLVGGYMNIHPSNWRSSYGPEFYIHTCTCHALHRSLYYISTIRRNRRKSTQMKAMLQGKLLYIKEISLRILQKKINTISLVFFTKTVQVSCYSKAC